MCAEMAGGSYIQDPEKMVNSYTFYHSWIDDWKSVVKEHDSLQHWPLYENRCGVCVKLKIPPSPQIAVQNTVWFAESDHMAVATHVIQFWCGQKKKKGEGCDLCHKNPWLKSYPKDTKHNSHRKELRFLWELHAVSWNTLSVNPGWRKFSF